VGLVIVPSGYQVREATGVRSRLWQSDGMRGDRARTLGAVGVLVITAALGIGCAPDGADEAGAPEALDGRADLTPTYAPTTASTAPGASSTTSATTASAAGGGATTTTAPAAPVRPTGTISDRVGDATTGEGAAPAWADIVGAVLVRHPEFLELRVALGAAAPSSSGAADRTMNVAAFFDVDGDGQVDYEIWANLAEQGWDGSWFDDRTGTAAYSDDAATDVLVDGGDLVVRFPPAYVGEAEAFRWSLASEYGRYATLGTPLTTRDDAPDGGTAAAFPG
jgi:hypothetical protein